MGSSTRRESGGLTANVNELWRSSVRLRQEVLDAREDVLQMLLGSVYDGGDFLEPSLERTVRMALIICTELERTCDQRISHYMRMVNPSRLDRSAGVYRRERVARPLRRMAGGITSLDARRRVRAGVTLTKARCSDPEWTRRLVRFHARITAWLSRLRPGNRPRPLAERILDVATSLEALMFDTADHAFVAMQIARQAVVELAGQTYDPMVVDAMLRAWPEVEAFQNAHAA